MAEVVNTGIIGAYLIRPTEYDVDEQLYTLQRYDSALGSVGHDQMHKSPPSFFVWSMTLAGQVAPAGTADSLPFTAPFPLTVWSAEVGVETLADGTATVDLRSDAASLLDAPEAVTAGAVARVAPEDGSEDIDFGSTLFMRCAKAAGAANGIGFVSLLTCQRR